MTELQLLRLFGLIFVAAGIGLLLSRTYAAALMEDFTDSPSALFILGLGVSIIGFLLVTFHSDWGGSWTSILITSIGWMALIKGLLSLAAPPLMHRVLDWVTRHQWLFTVGALAWIIIGGLFIATGFGLV